MAMDQRRWKEHHWYLQVEDGEEQTVAPRANERLYVTDAFLVGGQGVADVCVVIGNSWGADCIPLASLSAANPGVRGMVAVREGQECTFFVMPQGGGTAPGPVVVLFMGYVLAMPPVEDEGEAPVTTVENEGDWFVRVECGDVETFAPRADAPICVTAVFLPDPADADMGVVEARVILGTAPPHLFVSLSKVTPRVELRRPLVLDDKFSFSATGPPSAIVQFEGYVLAPPAPEEEEENDDEKARSSKLGHDSKDDSEVEWLAAVSASDEDEKEEDASSSEDDKRYLEEDNDGDASGHAATESSTGGGNTLLRHRSKSFVPEALGRPLGVLAPWFAFDRELVQQVAPGALIGFCVFVYLVACLISIHKFKLAHHPAN